jgi:regulator of extracellular matrix RemA (YlzA/DUF370 family)
MEVPAVPGELLHIGFGNMVVRRRVVAVLNPTSAEGKAYMPLPLRRLRDEAKEHRRLVDATCGRRVRAIILTDSDHVILSAIQARTITLRLEGRDGEAPQPEVG